MKKKNNSRICVLNSNNFPAGVVAGAATAAADGSSVISVVCLGEFLSSEILLS